MTRKAIRQIGVLLDDAGAIIGEQEEILVEVVPASGGNDAAAVVVEVRPTKGTLVAPQIASSDAPDARITWGSPATPFSHCRLYVNATSAAAAATALEANIETEIILPGIITVQPDVKITTLAIVPVYRANTVDTTDPAPIANGAGTRVYGCIPDALDYGGSGTEVLDRTIFWDFTANAASGVDMAKIIISPVDVHQQENAEVTSIEDTLITTLVRCTGYTFA